MLVLFTEYFKNKNNDRDQEVVFAINANIRSKLFDKIYILTEDSKDELCFDHNESYTEIVKVDCRQTFETMFKYVNSMCSEDDIAVVCNNDIYFDESVLKLEQLSTKQGWFLALLRRDLNVDGSSSLFEYEINDCFGRKGKRGDSQDAWIFKAPIKIPKQSNFYFGIPGCDNRIAYLMNELGYRVLNPCYDIAIYHNHKSNERNYVKGKDIIPGPYILNIKPCLLNDILPIL